MAEQYRHKDLLRCCPQRTYLTYQSLDRRQERQERLRVAILEMSDFACLDDKPTGTDSRGQRETLLDR